MNRTDRSAAPVFGDILSGRLRRRSMLAGGLAAAAGSFLAFGPSTLRAATGKTVPKPLPALSAFTPVPVAAGHGPLPVIAAEYRYEVLIPWGTALQPGGPDYHGEPDRRPSAAEQAQQIGIGHDGMCFFPIGGSSEHGLLAINHEYGDNTHLLGRAQPASAADVLLSQAAHGMSVVEIRRAEQGWQRTASKHARRIDANTPVDFAGPAADHALLRTRAGTAPRGTLSNCSNGHTPWGTYLSCEENFPDYFQTEAGGWTASPRQQRYGLKAAGEGFGWHRFDARFDLADADHAGTENQFGWVVEIDPWHPDTAPVKRTALGRIKHENAAVVTGGDGRVVVYMGDDERFEYIYKFVSAGNWRAMLDAGKSPLDEGSLYVARFDDDGAGEWLELTISNPRLAARFSSQAEILVFTRAAADLLGATPMDRAESIAVAPDGAVYCSLTNNDERQRTNAANPQAPNPDGHIIRWHDADRHLGTRFAWDIFLLSRDSHAADRDDTFSSPDGLWADPDGRLFILTDGDQQKGLCNQLLVADTRNGSVRRLLTGPDGCEITGITATPDRRTLFVNVQHPGDGDPKLTNFPAAPDGRTIPRDATLVISRRDGGVVGS